MQIVRRQCCLNSTPSSLKIMTLCIGTMEKERKKTIGEWNLISTWRRKRERRRRIFGQQRRRRPKKERGVRTLQYDQLLWENAIPAGVTTFSSTLEKCINILLILIMIIIIIIIIITTNICDTFTSAPFPNPPYVRLNLRMSTKSPPFSKSYIRTFDFMLSKDSLYWLTTSPAVAVNDLS